MNLYPGTCRDCGAHVPPKGGNYHRKERGRWTVRCRACIDDCNTARTAGKFATYEDWRAARQALNKEPKSHG